MIARELEPGERAGQYLSFEAGGARCGVPLTEVQELIEYQPVTRVPAAPAAVLGVFNLRGNVLPVVDLACRLGLPASPLGKRSSIVVLRQSERDEVLLVAVLVDSVDQVIEPLCSELRPVPSSGTRIARELLSAVLQDDHGLVHLLAVAPLLALEQAQLAGAS